MIALDRALKPELIHATTHHKRLHEDIMSSYSESHNHMASSQMSSSPPEQGQLQNREDRRIHPRWNLGFTRTGRLSTSLPNLQQVPKKRNYPDRIVEPDAKG